MRLLFKRFKYFVFAGMSFCLLSAYFLKAVDLYRITGHMNIQIVFEFFLAFVCSCLTAVMLHHGTKRLEYLQHYKSLRDFVKNKS